MRQPIFFSLLLALFTFSIAQAQFTPQSFSYQCVVRDANGNPIPNQAVTLLFSVRSGAPNGPLAYSEKQSTTTNQFGLVTLGIGQGTPIVGTFSGINWGGGAKFLTVSLETTPNVFDELGTSELLSVPYALYAANGGGGGNPSGDNWGTQVVETNPTLTGNGTGGNPLRIAQQSAQTGQVLKWNGNSWAPADDIASNGTNGGTVTQVNTGSGLSGGPITTSGTISLTNTGVTPGPYGSATQIPVISIDAQGRITSAFTVVASPGTIGLNGGTGINVQQNGSNYTVTNTGDTNAADDLTNTTQADGDVSGTFNNLQIKAGAVGTTELADNAVTTAKIGDGAVTATELASNAVTTLKIANGSITAAKLDPMGATSGQVLKWNGSAWAPAADQTGGGAGTLTGGTGISISGTAPNYTITNTGDTNASDDLTNATTANGDVSGTFSNLQIKSDVVTTTELAISAVANENIAAQAVTGDKIAPMSAAAGQVLKWNGTSWAPANDNSGGNSFAILPGPGIDVTTAGSDYVIINTGDLNEFNDITTTSVANGDISGTFDDLQINPFVITNTEMAANSIGTNNLIAGSVTGAKINQMNATSGQVLKWNGTTWAPANDDTSTGGGDNWGTQTVTTNATLTGNGTNANPLKLAQQGATNGQILKWNGTTWLPANDAGGDNWGTQTVSSGAALTGAGTSGNPLNLAQQGASIGQVLKWNGAGWVPANDLSGGGGSGDSYAAGTGITITGSSPSFTINNAGDLSTTNEIQTLSLNGSNLSLSLGGGTVALPSGNNYAAGSGIFISGTAPNLTISNVGDLSSSNELQTLSLNGSNLSLSPSGGTVTLPTGNTYSAGTGISISGSSPNFTVNNTGDLSSSNEVQTIALNGTTLSLSINNSSVDLSPLVTPNLLWKYNGNHIYNTNTENVLIGASGNASGKLQVTTTGSEEAGRFVVANAGSTAAAVFGQHDGAGPAAYFNSGSGPALITGDGNVGLGLSAPAYRLDVKGTGHFTAPTNSPGIKVEATGADYARIDMNNGSPGSWSLLGRGGAPNGDFAIDFSKITGSARVFAARGDGSVFIGAPTGATSRAVLYHGDDGITFQNNNNNHNWEFWVTNADGSLALYNDQLGTLTPAGTFALNGFYVPSDSRLKKDIAAIPGGILEKMLQLQPVSYRYKVEKDNAKSSIGFLAQDVQQLFPELVGQTYGRDGKSAYLNVNYGGLSVLAVKAIQEQQQQIQDLKKQNKDLEKRLERLEKMVEERK